MKSEYSFVTRVNYLILEYNVKLHNSIDKINMSFLIYPSCKLEVNEIDHLELKEEVS